MDDLTYPEEAMREAAARIRELEALVMRGCEVVDNLLAQENGCEAQEFLSDARALIARMGERDDRS